LITVDVSELKDISRGLSEYLRRTLPATVAVKGGTLVIDQQAGQLTSRAVRKRVKRFLHRRGLVEDYKAVKIGGVIRIKRRRVRKRSRAKTKGVAPSPYETLPYYYPRDR